MGPLGKCVCGLALLVANVARVPVILSHVSVEPRWRVGGGGYPTHPASFVSRLFCLPCYRSGRGTSVPKNRRCLPISPTDQGRVPPHIAAATTAVVPSTHYPHILVHSVRVGTSGTTSYGGSSGQRWMEET